MNKSKSLLKAFAVAALAMAGAAMLPSCTDNEEAAQEDWGSGTISGVVTDTGGDRIAAVSVTVDTPWMSRSRKQSWHSSPKPATQPWR